MKWEFRYERGGRQVAGFASIGRPEPGSHGQDWAAPVACDLYPRLSPIRGVSKEDAVALAKDFLQRLYAGFDLRDDAGSKLSWD